MSSRSTCQWRFSHGSSRYQHCRWLRRCIRKSQALRATQSYHFHQAGSSSLVDESLDQPLRPVGRRASARSSRSPGGRVGIDDQARAPLGEEDAGGSGPV
jgi:hypothetical protein